MSQSPRISSYDEFWRFYLHEHANPKTRLWHIAGTGAACVFLLAAIVTYRFEFLIAAFIAGYGPAWIAHVGIEKNRPATFRYPLWSLVADFRMTFAWVRGGLDRELERAGVANPQERPR